MLEIQDWTNMTNIVFNPSMQDSSFTCTPISTECAPVCGPQPLKGLNAMLKVNSGNPEVGCYLSPTLPVFNIADLQIS